MPFSRYRKDNSKKIKYQNEIHSPQNKLRHQFSSRSLDYLINARKSAEESFIEKRVVSFAFRSHGAVSIEASICLTLFLMAMLTLLSFGSVMNQRMRMSAPLRNTASKLAQNYSVYEMLGISDSADSILEEYAVNGIGIVAAKQLFIDEVGENNLDKSCVVDGSNGISFFYSDIPDKEGYVDLVITYDLSLPFQLIPMPVMEVTQRSRVHTWAGTKVFKQNNVRYVYKTRNGTVYHTSLSCKHLNISIKKTSVNTVDDLRNKSGAKYYSCEVCGNTASGSIVYVTEYGTSYHNKEDCFALTRNIERVSMDRILGLPECKSCGL